MDSSFAVAYHAANTAGVMAAYTADAVILPPNMPPVQGADSIRQMFAQFFGAARRPRLDLATSAVQGRQDLAYSSGTYRVTMPAAAPDRAPRVIDEGKHLEILMRQSDGSWKIVYDIWNSNLPPAPPPAPAPGRRG